MTTPKQKLVPTCKDWEHVAREFGDYDLEYDSFHRDSALEPVNSAHYVGNYVEAEAICKEVVRLRNLVEALNEKIDRGIAALCDPLTPQTPQYDIDDIHDEALRSAIGDHGQG